MHFGLKEHATILFLFKGASSHTLCELRTGTEGWGRAVALVVSGRRLSPGRGAVRGVLLLRAAGLGRGWTVAPGPSVTDGEGLWQNPHACPGDTF